MSHDPTIAFGSNRPQCVVHYDYKKCPVLTKAADGMPLTGRSAMRLKPGHSGHPAWLSNAVVPFSIRHQPYSLGESLHRLSEFVA